MKLRLTADPISAGSVKLNTLVHDSLPWKGNYFGGMVNILEALPDTPYQFINWSSGSQVFLPNDSAIISRVNFTSNDTVVAHFSFATPVFEVTGDVPVANVYPTMIDQFTTLDFSLPEALPVSIQLFNINGQLISTLADNSYMQTGFHSMRLSLNTGKLNEGVYILKFRAGNTQKSFKLVYTGR
jgi:hypothetical protein